MAWRLQRQLQDKAKQVTANGSRVHINALAHHYPETGAVIAPLDLSFEAGEFVALLGPSGCGKSTLLRLIAGLEKPTRGQILVGAALDSASPQTRPSNPTCGFVFQDAHLLPWRTVLRNVTLPLEISGLGKLAAQAAAQEALARVGLAEASGKRPHQLSGGMKMRASLARALVTRPSLLLLDEPFAALDENTRHSLQEDLRELWLALGMSVVFVTHSVSEAVFLANRAIVLSPRPARVLLDHRVQLPARRTRQLRTSPEFGGQIEIIHHASDSQTLAQMTSKDPP